MKKTELLAKASRAFNKVGFKLQKHSPEILIVAGVVGTVTSAVLACKATTKLSEILDEARDTVDNIHNYVENPDELPEGQEYTVEDSKKDLAVTYLQTGVKIAKLYAPAIALGALSIGAIVTSNNVLRKRNAALAAAYATVDKGFKEYRSRVVDRFGTEVDHELLHNVKAKQIEETVVDEKGKEKKVKKTVEVIDPATISPYTKIFDRNSRSWEPDNDYNKLFLRSAEAYFTNRLISTGRVFLNEVLDHLDIPITKDGQIVGWVFDKTAADPEGDNYVSFNAREAYIENPDFPNGLEPVFILDFNCQGNVWADM